MNAVQRGAAASAYRLARGGAPLRRAARRDASPRDDGAASVEFAVVLPVVVVSLLLVVQVALIAGAQLSVQQAAREGARAAAVWNDDARARDAALEAGGLDRDRATVAIEPSSRGVGDPVRVTVRYRPEIGVPFVGRYVPAGLELSAWAEARTERAPP
jgi:Flp pilus assembly protein TadG